MLRAHERRRPQRLACLRQVGISGWHGLHERLVRPPHPRPLSPGGGEGGKNLGEAPIDDERLAIVAEHDVGRFQVAVQHAAAVGIGHRVADGDEACQQLAEFEVVLGRPLHTPHPRPLSPRWGRGEIRFLSFICAICGICG